MSGDDQVILEWNFTPENYFEEPFSVKEKDYDLEIQAGKVIVTISGAVFDVNPDYRQSLHDLINKRFQANQLYARESYQLSAARMQRLTTDGKKHAVVFLESLTMTIKGGQLDFQHADAHGNTIKDTKAERIAEKRSLFQLTAKHGKDATYAGMLESFDAALRDPDKELVYLYQIRDSLVKKFGGENKACTQLGIREADWSQLGYLANGLPLIQGRHVGKNFGSLRQATQEELDEARLLARGMIQKYLAWLGP